MHFKCAITSNATKCDQQRICLISTLKFKLRTCNCSPTRPTTKIQRRRWLEIRKKGGRSTIIINHGSPRVCTAYLCRLGWAVEEIWPGADKAEQAEEDLKAVWEIAERLEIVWGGSTDWVKVGGGSAYTLIWRQGLEEPWRRYLLPSLRNPRTTWEEAYQALLRWKQTIRICKLCKAWQVGDLYIFVHKSLHYAFSP